MAEKRKKPFEADTMKSGTNKKEREKGKGQYPWGCGRQPLSTSNPLECWVVTAVLRKRGDGNQRKALIF